MESLTTSVKDIEENVIEMNKELSPIKPGTNLWKVKNEKTLRRLL